MSVENFQEQYDLKTNFLEYGGFALIIKLFMDNLEKPAFNLIRPANSLLKSILHKDTSGVSNLCKAVHNDNPNIAQNICTKWYENQD